jgi:O-antigen ligase
VLAEKPKETPARTLSVSANQWTSATFLALLMLVLAGPLLSGQSDSLTGEGNALRQVSYLLVFAGLLAATFQAGGVDRALRTSALVNILVLYCWLSLLWAINPGVGMRRAVLTTIIIYSIFVAVGALGSARTLHLIKTVLAAVLFLNFAAVVLMPQVGVHQFEAGGDPGLIGDWRGVFPDKNLTGAITAVTVLILWFDPRSKSNLVHLGLILGSLVFLVQTGSKTSLGIGLVSLVLGLSYRRYDWRWWPVAMVSLALLALAAAWAVLANWDLIGSILDRQDAFTGRTQIWSTVLAYLGDHWLLGSGYGSFWNVGPDSPIYAYARSGAWITRITSSHNGYLEVAAQIGVPGLLIAMVALFLHPLGRLLTDPGHKEGGAVLLALLVFCAGQNLTEATMLDRDNFVQFCLMWTIAAICQPKSAPAPAA